MPTIRKLSITRNMAYIFYFVPVFECGILWSACLYVCLYVCLSVCPIAYLKHHTLKFHQIICTCYMWPWLGSSMTAMRYDVLPVLWMTSCFHIILGIGRIKDDACVSSTSPGGNTGGVVWRPRLHLIGVALSLFHWIPVNLKLPTLAIISQQTIYGINPLVQGI